VVEDSSALAGISSASIQGRIALGPRAGSRVWRVGADSLRALIVAAFVVAGCTSGAQGPNAWQPSCPPGSYADVSVDGWFHVSWNIVQGRTGPALEGYVNNRWKMEAAKMQLAVERLDGAGQVVGCSELWISSVPPYSRAYFAASVPDSSARYQVRVLSFDWAVRGAN